MPEFWSRRDAAISPPAIGGQPAISTGLFVAPVVLTILTSRAGYDAAEAANLLSLEMTLSALTTIILSSFIRANAARGLALAGASFVVAGNAASLISSASDVLTLSRAFAGIGGGVLAAAITVISVRAHNPERLFSLQTICAIVVGSLCLALIPIVTPALGYRAPYVVLLIVAVVSTALVARLPTPKTTPARHLRAQRVATLSPVGVAALSCVVLTQLGQGGFWTFVGQYGLLSGLSEVEVGGFLSMATLIMLAGVVGAAFAGARFGRIGPLIALIAINAASILAITIARDPATYVVANVLQAVTNLSSVVFMLGLSAALDRSGRLAAAASGLVTLGNGLGPSLAGSIAGGPGIAAIGVAVLAVNAGALLAIGFVGSVLKKGRTA